MIMSEMAAKVGSVHVNVQLGGCDVATLPSVFESIPSLQNVQNCTESLSSRPNVAGDSPHGASNR